MKKKILYLLTCILMVMSCGKAGIDPISTSKCETEQISYEKAINAWIADPTSKTKCEAVKSSLNTLVNNCSILTVVEKKKYQDELKTFTCD